jgi:hypothetical protein
MTAVSSSSPLISMCRAEETVFYKIDRNEVPQERFEGLRKQFADLQCQDAAILKRLKVVPESAIVVLVPNDAEIEKVSRFNRITGIVINVFGKLNLNNKSTELVNDLSGTASPSKNFQLEAQQYRKALEEALFGTHVEIDPLDEEVPSAEVLQTMIGTNANEITLLNFCTTNNDDKPNPCYFSISLNDLSEPHAKKLQEELSKQLATDQETTWNDKPFLKISITKKHGGIFQVFKKMMEIIVKTAPDVPILVDGKQFTENLQNLKDQVDVESHPELADHKLLIELIKKEFGDQKRETRDQATSPIKETTWITLSPTKQPKPEAPKAPEKLLTITLGDDKIGFTAFLLHTLNLKKAERAALVKALEDQGLKVEDKQEHRKLFLAISLNKIEVEGATDIQHNILQVYELIKKALKEPLKLCFSDFITEVEKAQKLALTTQGEHPELENIGLLITKLKAEAASGEIKQLKSTEISALQKAHIIKPVKKTAKSTLAPINEPVEETVEEVVEPTLTDSKTTLNKPKKVMPQKQSWIRRILNVLAFPFLWYWNGLKNLFKTLFGRK